MDRAAAAGDLAALGQALLGGLFLGLVFFGGLWLTLCRVAGHRYTERAWPAMLLIGSFWLRIATLAAGLWWMGRGDPMRVLAAAAGVIAMRPVINRFVRARAPANENKANAGESRLRARS